MTLRPDLPFCNLSRRPPAINISPNAGKILNHFPCDLSRADDVGRAGRAVQDRESRLQRLLLGAGDVSTARARQILAESARFNIGPVLRNVNTPAVSLMVLHEANQARFTFTREADDRVDGGVVGAELAPDHHRVGAFVRFPGADTGLAVPARWLAEGGGAAAALGCTRDLSERPFGRRKQQRHDPNVERRGLPDGEDGQAQRIDGSAGKGASALAAPLGPT